MSLLKYIKFLKPVGFILENLNGLDGKKNKEELHSFSQFKLKNIYDGKKNKEEFHSFSQFKLKNIYDGGMINV